MSEFKELVARFARKDRQSLSRLLSLAARGEETDAIRAAIRPDGGRVVAITGSGGVGKSSLIGGFVKLLRGRGKTVAVLACDPESPLTGGALLGDRMRMAGRAEDPGLFIRSLATPGGRQAIADNVDLMLDLARAFGFDVVLLETVGAGQGDTAVRDLADVLVLLVQPESGDDLQWEKAGLLEVADVVVINKSDLPGADRLEAQLRPQLDVPGEPVPLLKVSSTKRQGLEELWSAIESQPSRKDLLERAHEKPR